MNILSGIITEPTNSVNNHKQTVNQTKNNKRKSYHHIVILTNKQLELTKSYLDKNKIDYDKNVLEDKNESL